MPTLKELQAIIKKADSVINRAQSYRQKAVEQLKLICDHPITNASGGYYFSEWPDSGFRHGIIYCTCCGKELGDNWSKDGWRGRKNKRM